MYMKLWGKKLVSQPGQQDAFGSALAARDSGGRVAAAGSQDVHGLEGQRRRLVLEALRLIAAQQRAHRELLHRRVLHPGYVSGIYRAS